MPFVRSTCHTLLPVLLVVIVLAPAQGEARRARTSVLLIDTSRPEVDPELRREVLEGLATSLKQRRGIRVLSGPPEGATPNKIAQLLDRAKAHSEQFQEAEALQVLKEAEDRFRETIAGWVKIDALIQVLLTKAKLLADLKQTKPLAATLSRLVVLDPDHTLDPGVFAPPLIQTFKRLKAKLRRQRATLEVITDPADQPVWVDGRPLGRSPEPVEVFAGEHFVVAGFDGAVGRAVQVTVGPPTSLTLTIPKRKPPSDRQLKARGRRAGASWVAAMRLVHRRGQRQQIRVRLLSCRTVDPPRNLRSASVARVQLTWATSKLAIRLRAALAPRTRIASRSTAQPGTSPLGPPVETSRSVLKTWWFWTAVAAVVGGGVAAAVVLTRDDDPGVRIHMAR